MTPRKPTALRTARHLARALAALAFTLCAGAAATATAEEPNLGEANVCDNPGGQGDPCTVDDDCRSNLYATICVEHTPGIAASRRCEIPCEATVASALTPANEACAVGETCVEGRRAGAAQKRFYCRPGRFRMDLNLLDSCIKHFLDGNAPVVGAGANACSLQANFDRLLDQNGDQTFDVFDVDLCVVSFLEQPGCDPVSGICDESDLIACDADTDCGNGLYCDLERNACARDCGLVPSREPELESLDRECTGALQTCDRGRGRCVEVDVQRQTCGVDRDCPSGAYCFLGRCEPNCYRAVDCPDSEWYCTRNNRCRPLPRPAPTGGFVFEPTDYAIRFGRDLVNVTAIEPLQGVQLLVMNTRTRKRVVNNASVTFGYRLEITYANKADAKCLKPFVDCDDRAQRPANETADACRARQADCIIDPSEAWLTPLSPFGTIAAVGDPRIQVQLEPAIADRLTPGAYTATVRAIYDNGDSDSFRVSYTKSSPSGEYGGQLQVYLGSERSSLTGARPLDLAFHLKVTDEVIRWNDLMARYGIVLTSGSDGFVDITRGFLVRGQLHGNKTFAFTKTAAVTSADNEIPMIGLYSPDLGRMRMVSLIEIPKEVCTTAGCRDYCVGESGACTEGDESELQVRNLFGRDIRRQLEFIGPFDEATRRFFGVYREKISGLASDFDITLDGSFLAQQVAVDESDIADPGRLLPAGASAVRFPSSSDVEDALDDEIAAACSGMTEETQTNPSISRSAAVSRGFGSSAEFDAYLASIDLASFEQMDKPIFPRLLQFSSAIEAVLGALDTSTAEGRQDELNIFDFVSDRVLPCDPTDPSPSPVCIDEQTLRCGLALYQKAIVAGWVEMSSAGAPTGDGASGDLPLFCDETIPSSECPADPTTQPDLFALHDHGRFWKGLGEILKFDADRARSDAFMVMFRNEVNPFSHGAALDYKNDRLRHSVRRYDELVQLIAGPAGAKTLFRWPARAFRSAGNDWLRIMQTVVSDRMEVLAEVVDLKRRIFLGSSGADFIYAHHLMQQEYLLQVYLITLQQHWQQEIFSYSGAAPKVFEKGQGVVNQLNPAKNALGVTPDQVFFENRNTHISNWENYREILVGANGSGGLLARARGQVRSAVENLRNSLQDLDALEKRIYDSQTALLDTMESVCGPSVSIEDAQGNDTVTAVTDANYCQYLIGKYHNYADWQKDRDCSIGDGDDSEADNAADKAAGLCPNGVAVECDTDFENALVPDDRGEKNTCKRIVKSFRDGTDAINAGTSAFSPKCALTYDGSDPESYIIMDGQPRPCMGGEVGALRQQKIEIDLSRRTVLNKVEGLVTNMGWEIERLKRAQETDASSEAGYILWDGVFKALQVGISSLVETKEVAKTVTEIPGCVFIVGLAGGTDCPQNAIAFLSKASVQAVLGAITNGLKIVEFIGAQVKAGLERAGERKARDLDAGQSIAVLAGNMDDLVAEYGELTQQSFNIGIQIEEARRRAQYAVDGFGYDATFFADHLVGRETGNILLGDYLVAQSEITFRELVQYAYRMTVAFNHHYNVPPAEAQSLINEALSLLTLDEVEVFVGELSDRQRDYCGREGIDCDSDSNFETLRYSVRDNLFPQLTDVVDARTGEVLTVGEQFHSIITQTPYVRRRIRGPHAVEQIEIPISLPVTLQENSRNGPRWLLDPLSCNQLLGGSPSGNIAVSVQLTNQRDPAAKVQYELVRGATDFIRGCQLESVVGEIGTLPVLEFPIRRHIIGYAPQNANGNLDSPPSFVTRSSPFEACLQSSASSELPPLSTCWRLFARDRSLASPDWKVVIPLSIGGGATENAWLRNDDLPRAERTIVEDIVLYFRYRARPVQDF